MENLAIRYKNDCSCRSYTLGIDSNIEYGSILKHINPSIYQYSTICAVSTVSFIIYQMYRQH